MAKACGSGFDQEVTVAYLGDRYLMELVWLLPLRICQLCTMVKALGE